MSLNLTQSHAQHNRARNSLAGGVATAFRAAQEPVPVSFTSSAGARMTDVDGNQYVDFALSFGPLLLGHSPAPVLAAVRTQLGLGLGYGASHPLEPALAEAVCRTVPSAELCVFSEHGQRGGARGAAHRPGRDRTVTSDQVPGALSWLVRPDARRPVGIDRDDGRRARRARTRRRRAR